MSFEPNLPRTRVKASGIVKSPAGRHTAWKLNNQIVFANQWPEDVGICKNRNGYDGVIHPRNDHDFLSHDRHTGPSGIPSETLAW